MRSRVRAWYGARRAWTSSGSADSDAAVKPTRSQKSTETTFRSLAPAGAGVSESAAPQCGQNGNSPGRSLPQAGHAGMRASLRPCKHGLPARGAGEVRSCQRAVSYAATYEDVRIKRRSRRGGGPYALRHMHIQPPSTTRLMPLIASFSSRKRDAPTTSAIVTRRPIGVRSTSALCRSGAMSRHCGLSPTIAGWMTLTRIGASSHHERPRKGGDTSVDRRHGGRARIRPVSRQALRRMRMLRRREVAAPARGSPP